MSQKPYKLVEEFLRAEEAERLLSEQPELGIAGHIVATKLEPLPCPHAQCTADFQIVIGPRCGRWYAFHPPSEDCPVASRYFCQHLAATKDRAAKTNTPIGAWERAKQELYPD